MGNRRAEIKRLKKTRQNLEKLREVLEALYVERYISAGSEEQTAEIEEELNQPDHPLNYLYKRIEQVDKRLDRIQ